MQGVLMADWRAQMLLGCVTAMALGYIAAWMLDEWWNRD